MSRQPFSLSDGQARELLVQVAPILERHLDVGGRDHRPFVHEFIRAVHGVTGETYSASIYQRLIDAFAPGRRIASDTARPIAA